jgi:myo-inositol-1(or 4)-monophosphatase
MPEQRTPVSTAQATVLGLDPLVDLAWRCAREAGAFLRDERPADLGISTKSTPTDVVTAMDRASESLIIERILGERPADAILGEEGGSREGTTGVTWVIDPLDGTVNYTYALPMWAVSIGIEINGVRHGGVVYAPVFEATFVGLRDQGAWRLAGEIAEPLAVNSPVALDLSLVATGFGYSAERRIAQAAALERIIGQVRDIRRSGCASLDLCWLASGLVDAYFERGLNAWDVSAGAVIASEAGAVIREFGDFTYASSPEVAAKLMPLLEAAGATAGS